MGDELERVSDADRERAVELVQAALGDGRIGLDEIDERLGAVVAARTRGDLEAALVHLPGRWEVPAHLIVTMVHSSMVLDLTEADLPGPEIRVDLDFTHSRLRVIVPDDIRVEAYGLEQHGRKCASSRLATPRRPVLDRKSVV